MIFKEKVENIQRELKVPKNSYNKFGGYNYRSAEDILEAFKKLKDTHDLLLTVSDEMVLIGERYYVKATATLSSVEGEKLSVTAYAREPENKKGMDEMQITGAASSYARKYALNGLFLLDDTKDADSDEYVKQTKQNTNTKQQASTKPQTETKQQTAEKQAKSKQQQSDAKQPEKEDKFITSDMVAELKAQLKKVNRTEEQLMGFLKVSSLEEIKTTDFFKVMNEMERSFKANTGSKKEEVKDQTEPVEEKQEEKPEPAEKKEAV